MNQPYIYVDGKYTPCTLREMLDHYDIYWRNQIGLRSDGTHWLGDVIEQLRYQLDEMPHFNEVWTFERPRVHHEHDLLAGDI